MRLPEAQSRYLDAWRGGSAIFVLVGHSFEIFQVHAASIWGAPATGAVMIFFVLSGFFIRRSLDTCLAQGRPDLFIAARVNRIVPPFLFSLLLVLFLWWLAPFCFATGARTFAVPTSMPGFSIRYFLSTSLFLNGFFGGTMPANGALWSLSYEVWYYVLALLLAVPRWRAAGLAVGAVLAWRDQEFAILGLIWALGFFLPRLPRWLLVLPLLALPLELLWPDDLGAAYGWELAVGLAFASHLSRLPEKPPRLWIERSAAWSYTLYVIHFPLLLFAYGTIGANWLVPFAILGLAAAIGPVIERIKLITPAPRPHIA